MTVAVTAMSNQLKSTIPSGAQNGVVVPRKASSTVPSVNANPNTSGASNSIGCRNCVGFSSTWYSLLSLVETPQKFAR